MELAQLNYLLPPRLTGKGTALSRLGAGGLARGGGRGGDETGNGPPADKKAHCRSAARIRAGKKNPGGLAQARPSGYDGTRGGSGGLYKCG